MNHKKLKFCEEPTIDIFRIYGQEQKSCRKLNTECESASWSGALLVEIKMLAFEMKIIEYILENWILIGLASWYLELNFPFSSV